jgi:uncharacterized protein YndB with AHSA1/START domain
MKKHRFTTHISAPRERVWHILWDDATYRAWTAAFIEGSHAQSDWQEGSEIRFLSPGGNGMVSRIAKLVPNQEMTFEHLGEIKNGVEDFASAEEKGWKGALEKYELHEQDGGTRLEAELDADEAEADYFAKTFPIALAKVKELAEA